MPMFLKRNAKMQHKNDIVKKPLVNLSRFKTMEEISSLENGLRNESRFGLEVSVAFQNPDEAAFVDVLEDLGG